MTHDERIVIRLQNTPSGRLLARAIEIMHEADVDMGQAMAAAARERAQYGKLAPCGRHMGDPCPECNR